MSDDLRRVPVVFLSGNVGVSKTEKNQGKKFLSMDVAEIAMSQDGVPYVRAFGQGKERQLAMSYFKWLDEWSGSSRDFNKIKPFDIIYLCFSGSGITGGKLVDFELAQSSDLLEKYFAL